VLRTRFEREPPLHAPALAVTLRAPDLAPSNARTRALFEPESRAEIALPKLVAELAALLGDGTVGRLTVVDDWRLDHRSVLVPFGSPVRSESGHTPEPLRLVPPTQAGRPIELLHHVARFERISWWREVRAPMDWHLAWTGDAMSFVSVDREHQIRGYLD
jgi:hypothetical protein